MKGRGVVFPLPFVFFTIQTSCMAHRISGAILVLLVSTSCYRLTPVEGGAPERGLEVRLSLSDEGSVRMAPLIGPRIAAIDGRVLEAVDTAYVLAVTAVVAQGGRSMAWSNERLTVPRSGVSSVRTRTLDRKKTWITAVLGVVGAIALGEVFGLGTGFDGFLGGGDGGGKK
jgi:hypothetical protein